MRTASAPGRSEMLMIRSVSIVDSTNERNRQFHELLPKPYFSPRGAPHSLAPLEQLPDDRETEEKSCKKFTLNFVGKTKSEINYSLKSLRSLTIKRIRNSRSVNASASPPPLAQPDVYKFIQIYFRNPDPSRSRPERGRGEAEQR